MCWVLLCVPVSRCTKTGKVLSNHKPTYENGTQLVGDLRVEKEQEEVCKWDAGAVLQGSCRTKAGCAGSGVGVNAL